MRYRDLPDLVVWPLLFAALLALLLGGISFALSPRYGPLGLIVAGAASWGLMRRYYGAREASLKAVFRLRPDGRVGTSGWAVPLCIGLFMAPAVTWLAIVGVDPQLPAGVSPADAFWKISFVVTAPINEEVIFRGVLLFGLLACGCRPVVAMPVQALLFMAAHGFPSTPFQMSTQFLCGITFALVALHHGGLVQALAVHVSWNLIEQFRAVLSGSLAPDSPLVTAWHAGVPPLVGIVLSIASMWALNRRTSVQQRLSDLSRPRPPMEPAAHTLLEPPAVQPDGR
jgi:membrane protease YdiL (CAAX protease family)